MGFIKIGGSGFNVNQISNFYHYPCDHGERIYVHFTSGNHDNFCVKSPTDVDIFIARLNASDDSIKAAIVENLVAAFDEERKRLEDALTNEKKLHEKAESEIYADAYRLREANASLKAENALLKAELEGKKEAGIPLTGADKATPSTSFMSKIIRRFKKNG